MHFKNAVIQPNPIFGKQVMRNENHFELDAQAGNRTIQKIDLDIFSKV